jgi:hypothetical protein
MPVSIRKADLIKDRRLIVEFLHKNLTGLSDDRRYDWLYLQNPFGPAHVWLMYGEDSEELIGSAAAFPRLVQVGGNDLVCWNLGDFVIKESFRSLGPAVSLQRACLGPVKSGEISFCYDHPSKSMMAIYNRIGVPASGWITRYAKPLRLDGQVEKYLGGNLPAKALSALGNSLLASWDKVRFRKGKLEIALEEGRFGDEFSELDQRTCHRYKVCGRRTAQYLNWRYKDNPLADYEVVTLREGGRLLAYVVFSHRDRHAVVSDLFGDDTPSAVRALLGETLAVLRKRSIHTVSVPASEGGPLTPSLEQAGFYPREKSPLVIYAASKGPWDGLVNVVANWFLSYGDRDS